MWNSVLPFWNFFPAIWNSEPEFETFSSEFQKVKLCRENLKLEFHSIKICVPSHLRTTVLIQSSRSFFDPPRAEKCCIYGVFRLFFIFCRLRSITKNSRFRGQNLFFRLNPSNGSFQIWHPSNGANGNLTPLKRRTVDFDTPQTGVRPTCKKQLLIFVQDWLRAFPAEWHSSSFDKLHRSHDLHSRPQDQSDQPCSDYVFV